MQTLALFTSNYSIGSSILTLEAPEEKEEVRSNYPQSILQICSDNNIRNLFLVETNMSGFVRGLKNAQNAKINLNFGLKLIVCSDIKKRDSESLSGEFKVILFARDDEGYKLLSKIYSVAATQGFYYQPRTDCEMIREFWDDNHLLLTHPFYDSFLHRNTLYLANCTPDFDFCKRKIFFIEQNDLPFNYLIEEAISKFGIENVIERVNIKSIVYKNNDDFKSFIAYKAIHNRKTLNCPDQEHMASNQFSFESWQQLNN